MPPRTVVEIRYNHFPAIADRLPDAAGDIVKEHAFRIEAEAKIVVPVDTGALKNSIQTEPESETSYVVYTAQDYAIFVEYGTVKMAARPYMTPAAETVRPRFLAAMRDLEDCLGRLNAVDRWIYGSLTADAQLTAVVGNRVYVDVATNGAAMPYVVYQMQAAVDLMTVGPLRVWADTLYLVRGVTEATSYSGALKTIADRIDAVLHAKQGANVDGTIWACVRERPHRLAELADGRNYRHAGAIFRIYAI